MNDSLENLWRRAKREAEIKVANIGSEGPFPDNYGTADEVLTDDLPQVLEIAAEEMDSAPSPTRRYRKGGKTGRALRPSYSEPPRKTHRNRFHWRSRNWKPSRT